MEEMANDGLGERSEDGDLVFAGGCRFHAGEDNSLEAEHQARKSGVPRLARSSRE